jgi:uncharacterized protein (DUF433 family)
MSLEFRRRKMAEHRVVHRHPEILSGEPVFVGTRVPVQALVDYLEEGDTIESFLDAFPTINREQVIGFIEQATRALIAQLPRAPSSCSSTAT